MNVAKMSLFFLGICILLACSEQAQSQTGLYVAEYPGHIKNGWLRLVGNGFYSMGDSLIVEPDGSFKYISTCNQKYINGYWKKLDDNIIKLFPVKVLMNNNLINDSTYYKPMNFNSCGGGVLNYEENSKLIETGEDVKIKYHFKLQDRD